jgi:hypothetical protein
MGVFSRMTSEKRGFLLEQEARKKRDKNRKNNCFISRPSLYYGLVLYHRYLKYDRETA